MTSQLEAVHLLVDLLLKDETKVPVSEVHKLTLRSYATRLLGSQLSQSASLDDQGILLGITKDLESRGKAASQIARVSELVSRLNINGTLSGRAKGGILYLLRMLSKDSQHRGVRSASQGSAKSLHLMTQSLSATAMQPVLPSPTGSAHTHRPHTQPYSVAFPPSESASLSGSQVFQDFGASAPRRRTTSSEDASLFTIKEPLLVKDVLHACLGVNGKYTSYQADRFLVNPQVEVPIADHEQMSSLMELGFLFKRVQQHVADSLPENGAIHQAMCAAMGSECKDFYRFMAVLQSQASEPIPMPGEDQEQQPVAPYLTIRRLGVWLAEPMRRMRLLATLADATEGLSGGALAGAIYAHVHAHGDPFVRSYTSRVLQAACVPLFEMIRRWVYEGQIEDPHGEFFIIKQNRQGLSAAATGNDRQQQQQQDMWRNGYTIDPSRLPSFLSQKLASKILRAGKSINFLQECCEDVSWVHERAISAQAAASSIVSTAQIEGLERFVATASAGVDQRVMEMLINKFDLAKHCDAMRRYVLLGQGDFVQALMDTAQADLNQDASSVSEISLNHAVRQAISASNTKYDDEDIVDRVRARKSKAHGGGELGWDVFRLHYEMRGPLSTLFTPSAQSQYFRVFQLLWRLKRAECDLSNTWKVLKCEVERTAAKFNSYSPGGANHAVAVARKCLRLRSEMSHFCTNFQYYIMFEVLEAAWQEFQHQASSAADMDELIFAHEKYLSTLVRKALLGEQTEGLRVTLKELLENMLTLRGQVRKLSDVIRVAYSRLSSSRARIQQRTQQGQWGTVTGDEDIREMPAADFEPLNRALEELDKRHRRGIADFTQKLPSQAHEEVRFLLYRLDFTEFYKRSAAMSEDSNEEAIDGMNID
ncbi:hypothetical protein CEUSTIGMA_g13633.t1 [Chlamydomonas eustigma]|uniref:Uncharacterized protein n=1 Tax=Chlamydomonas eustigma TaxID=1157962 RepID=A0A250XTU3_9CHLO|nr:hypothetical protein CEUSTIGMA_g13633.t1 [Chlamydomonas eustigma]|eukprot:GAX86220.1 hypothetical protein CEUSTIGMA_g13633.t1 [Chlamydomonas eustigma]